MSGVDWDLHAIVRSCKVVVNTAPSATETSSGLVEEERDHPLTFPTTDLSKNGSLQDCYVPFMSQPKLTTTTTTIDTNRVIDPSFHNGGTSVHQHHQHQSLQGQEVKRSRKRTRKRQQKRTVCHVTAANLLSDPWAWRKYGQKPIKGTLYPRHYYRCSSAKGCSARKHVQRSDDEPNVFIVTYISDHSHPRPIQRNPQAGKSRKKLSTILTDTTNLYPMTQYSAPCDNAAAKVHDTGADGSKDNVVVEDNVLLHVDDDFFNGMEEIIDGICGAGGDSCSGLEYSWSEFSDNWGTGSPTAGATASGGC